MSGDKRAPRAGAKQADKPAGEDAGLVLVGAKPGGAAGAERVGDRLPAAVIALCKAHGYDPAALLAWNVRDGRAVIIGPDGRKFKE